MTTNEIRIVSSDKRDSAIATKREIGFAISILGYGLVLFIGFVILARPTRVNDPTLDGTERFAEAIGELYLNAILTVAAFVIAVTCGSVGAFLGSRAGKILLLLTGLSVVLFLLVIGILRFLQEG